MGGLADFICYSGARSAEGAAVCADSGMREGKRERERRRRLRLVEEKQLIVKTTVDSETGLRQNVLYPERRRQVKKKGSVKMLAVLKRRRCRAARAKIRRALRAQARAGASA